MFQWERFCKLLLGNGVPAMAGQLTLEERDRIAQLRHQHANRKEIAHALGRSPATIGRELRRNATGENYFHACALAQQGVRAAAARTSHRAEDGRSPDQPSRQRTGLAQEWAPEQIAGRLKQQEDDRSVSPQTIYAWIQRDEDRKHWESMLRRAAKRRSGGSEKHGSDGRRRPHSQSSGGHRGAAAAGRL